MKKSLQRIRSLIFPFVILFLALIFVSYVGIKSRWFRAPYPSFGKEIAWLIGLPEQAYNFDIVLPGKLYRSGKPDEKFLSYVKKKYGIQNIISFTGKEPSHEFAREIGLNVVVYEWSTRHLPDKQELKEVIDYIDRNRNTLVHCAGGSDRTGYTVAFYRMWRQQWPVERAVHEMEKYWHDPEKKKKLQFEIKEMINNDNAQGDNNEKIISVAN